jgi:hypothetical protein
MRAEMGVAHEQGDMVGVVSGLFGAPDAAALDRSLLFADDPDLQAKVAYVSEVSGFRVICCKATPYRVDLFIEPVRGDLKDACQTVWSGIRTSAGNLKPRLEALQVFDEATAERVRTGERGLRARTRGEYFTKGATAGGTVLWIPIAIALGANPGAVTLGAVPALVAGGIATLQLAQDLKHDKLVWRD